MAATSAVDAAAHGFEVMGQRLNRNAEEDLKRFGKQNPSMKVRMANLFMLNDDRRVMLKMTAE